MRSVRHKAGAAILLIGVAVAAMSGTLAAPAALAQPALASAPAGSQHG